MSDAPWERTLHALDAALVESPTERAGIEIGWRLAIADDRGVEVVPAVHKRGKNGKPGAGAVVTRRRLLIEHAGKLAPEDARIAMLLPEDEGFASRAAMEALVGHPRLSLQHAPDR
ncbi:MAG: hypothetical protein ACK4YP_07835, partial [Myxococcota bacterium]